MQLAWNSCSIRWLQLRQCFYSLDRPPYATRLQPAETLLSETIKLNHLQPAISPQGASKHDKMNVWYSSSKHIGKLQACWHPLNWLGSCFNNWNVSDAFWFPLSPQPSLDGQSIYVKGEFAATHL